MNFILTYIIFSIVKTIVLAQINGEFWWLNNKFTALAGVDIPNAKFEELDSFANDESDKITFRNLDVNYNKDFEINLANEILKNKTETSEEFNLNFISNISGNEIETAIRKNLTYNKDIPPNLVRKNEDSRNKNNGTMESNKTTTFLFPDEKALNPKIQKSYHQQILFPSITEQNKSHKTNYFINNIGNTNISKYNQVLIEDYNTNTDVEPICNYISRDLCTARRGFVYENKCR